ncbi:MAG: hypothetical protein I3273_01720 [Candidatus Moeniiplasma glomeromycotorum]|nr:hypothetical protein [Candidatus Moeniiplasma glomeromycotorum]MCE8167161.1 hypothetical protein [Candidatus Moeniiplasma glomeromycotorum]MCE8168827.1 hypothetical protein [Candidatus Moeniiplasma glomeromycotorum]
MVCDACGAKKGSSWASYHGMWGLEQEILSDFVSQKSGKNQRGFFDFELCGECNKEYKKFFSQELKKKITAELAGKNSIDFSLLLEYGCSNKFEIDDWEKVRNALVENIHRYRSEWRIKQINYNRDGKEYFHPETNSQTSQLTVLIYQSTPIEYSSNGFLIVKQPKMYLKSYFPQSKWN